MIIAGAGPAGTSAATFLARQGVDTLLLDRAGFPRDKVCGDGLTPQAIYWLDQLGCVDEVLAETKACIKECDLYIDGRRLLTGGFARDTRYPDFAILLDRRRFDHILLRNAIDAGARFEGNHSVREIEVGHDGVTVFADARGQSRRVSGPDRDRRRRRQLRRLPPAREHSQGRRDGGLAARLLSTASSRTVRRSRCTSTAAFSPATGGCSSTTTGFANIGLGYAYDKNFPLRATCARRFTSFIERDLGELLANSSQMRADLRRRRLPSTARTRSSATG